MTYTQSSISFFQKMKSVKTAAVFLLMAVFVTVLLPAQSPSAEISVIFTHDMHSHFDAERYMENGKAAQRGGFAYMKSAIDNIIASYPDSFLLDAGDFAMGTPYQTIFSAEAAELRLMGLMGFEATTLGNHEFDYRTQGLTDMLNTAIADGGRLPPIIIANIDWDRTLADESRAVNAAALKDALECYGTADYMIIEKGGIRAAVFGILGMQADSYAPLSGLYFKNQVETSKEIVAKIKAEAAADIIICLSHSGTNDNPQKSEDELLAAAVPDIDIIISGHSHTKLNAPIIIGNTVVASCGEYTYNIGHIRLIRDGDRYKVSGYELIPISGDLQKDAGLEAAILKFRALVDSRYFSRFGYSFDQQLAYSDFSFIPIERFGKVQGEDTLGNLISDSYIAAVKKAEGDSYRKVDVAVVPSGVVRGSFTEGIITVADAFNVSSLGIGPDRIPGYPLVSIYLTGKELKTAAEIDVSVSILMGEARLYMSGLSYTYNPHRLLLNRVTNVRLADAGGKMTALDDKKLYRVVSGLYSCQMLGAVEAQSFGILKVTPKDENSNPITDFEKHIVYDGDTELKEWAALANYLGSFESPDGISKIPEYYNRLHGRKIEETGRTPAALLKNPNKIFFILLGALLLILAIITVPTCLIIRRVRRKKRGN
ncbi:MAG: bifunctional metallophosphatase/5'-nucleotidase [Treponema sp.]|jgi:2',3'-cyclic-nucleotide 2'-phosphodiesterase (5'-nucleotidase family)|nr:bifunctional metallophosphatase/5'-nucleotidase [Treponema sp.]